MEACCLRVERRMVPVSRHRPELKPRLELDICLGPQTLSIDLFTAFRPHFRILQPRQQEAVIATMPATVNVEQRRKRLSTTYVIACHDLDFWADQVRDWLAARQPPLT